MQGLSATLPMRRNRSLGSTTPPADYSLLLQLTGNLRNKKFAYLNFGAVASGRGCLEISRTSSLGESSSLSPMSGPFTRTLDSPTNSQPARPRSVDLSFYERPLAPGAAIEAGGGFSVGQAGYIVAGQSEVPASTLTSSTMPGSSVSVGTVPTFAFCSICGNPTPYVHYMSHWMSHLGEPGRPSPC